MYEIFYKLAKDPFRLIPDHHFCYRHRSYVRADAYVQYALSRGEGIVLITGEPGTGKTTLSADLLARLGSEKVTAARLVTTQLEAGDFLRAVALAFGLDIQTRDKLDVLRKLESFLAQQQEQSRRALLIVDEAHELSDSAFTELRLLTNLVHTEGQPLLQVILLGQKDILETLHAPRMEQLRQRVVAGRHLQPLDDENETQAYIEHRLKQAGWTGYPALNSDVFAFIHRQAGGIPRVINLLCSRLLLYGALEERSELTISDLELVTEGLRREQLLPRDSSAAVDKTQPVGTAEATSPVGELPKTIGRQHRILAVLGKAARQVREPSFRRTWVPAAGAVAAGLVSWIALSNLESPHPDVGRQTTVQALNAPSDERIDTLPEQVREPADTTEVALADETVREPVSTLLEEAALQSPDIDAGEVVTPATEGTPAPEVSGSEPPLSGPEPATGAEPASATTERAPSTELDSDSEDSARSELAALQRRWQQLEEQTVQITEADTATTPWQQTDSGSVETREQATTSAGPSTVEAAAVQEEQSVDAANLTALEPNTPATQKIPALPPEQPSLDDEAKMAGSIAVSDTVASEVETAPLAETELSSVEQTAPQNDTLTTGNDAAQEPPVVIARTETSLPATAPSKVADDALANSLANEQQTIPETRVQPTLFHTSRLAIVPFQTGTGCAWPIETVMVETIIDLVQENDTLELTYSSYAGTETSGRMPSPPDLWQNDSTLDSPDPATAYAVGETLGVALVVTAQIDCAQGSRIYEDWRPFDIYLYDVERNQIHHHRNSLKNLTKGTQKVFSDFLAARGLALQTR